MKHEIYEYTVKDKASPRKYISTNITDIAWAQNMFGLIGHGVNEDQKKVKFSEVEIPLTRVELSGNELLEVYGTHS